ncbi:MAG: hypothetical protein FWE21_01200 [Defluviitaleaceae bacterium]|nr:hypothetical protein [Defluviitaleaceae bacterium]
MSDLREKYARVAALPRHEERLTATRRVLEDTDKEITQLLQKYKREKRDVERIERDGLSAFLLRLVGRYEDKLEKGQQQEIEAKLTYDKAKARRQQLAEEELELHQLITRLKDEEKLLTAEFDARRKKLAGRATEHCKIVNHMADVQDAQRAVQRVQSCIDGVLKSLGSAKGWATWDIFTRGGILTHMAKYSHLDEAEQAFCALSAQLKSLVTKLEGMAHLHIPNLTTISRTQRGVDFWFNNIFTSISVHSQIEDSIREVEGLKHDLSKVHNALCAQLTQLEKQEEELLLAMGCMS